MSRPIIVCLVILILLPWGLRSAAAVDLRLDGLTAEQSGRAIFEAADQLEAKEAEYGEETWALVERAVLLRRRVPANLRIKHARFRKRPGARRAGGLQGGRSGLVRPDVDRQVQRRYLSGHVPGRCVHQG